MTREMTFIPKKIHYCWFGRNPLPESAQKCIASWRKYLADYEIIEWNEDNFDVNSIQFTKEAYEAKKYAFVSDYARFKILHEHGGLYFDTDVEVIRNMEDIVENGSFMGIEESDDIWNGINPGLGIGSNKGNEIYKEILDIYDKMSFSMHNGTVVKHTTEVMHTHGYDGTRKTQKVKDITVYAPDYFCPMNASTGIIKISDNSRSIHHYSCSWVDKESLQYKLYILKRMLNKVFGPKLVNSIVNIVKMIKK